MTTVPSSFLLELPLQDVERIGYAPVHAPSRDEYEPHYDHSEFDGVDEPAERPPVRPRKPQQPSVTTAAQLLSNRKTERPAARSVDEFSQGMLVTHPEYGFGRIIALSGSGPKRTATVRFLNENGEDRKFVLAFSGLVPVREEG